MLVFLLVKEYTYYHHTMRHYESDVSVSHMATPAEYLHLPEHEKLLPSLQTFYERFGHSDETPDCKGFPVLESLKMTRALHRSILILRSNGANFQNIEYRLFLFNFRSKEYIPEGNAEEYRFRGGHFSLLESSASFTPLYRHHLAFRRIGGNILSDTPDVHLELSSDPSMPGRLTSDSGEYLLDDIRALDIPTITRERMPAPLGQLAVIRTGESPNPLAS